jgi:hypothetical protein
MAALRQDLQELIVQSVQAERGDRDLSPGFEDEPAESVKMGMIADRRTHKADPFPLGKTVPNDGCQILETAVPCGTKHVAGGTETAPPRTSPSDLHEEHGIEGRLAAQDTRGWNALREISGQAPSDPLRRIFLRAEGSDPALSIVCDSIERGYVDPLYLTQLGKGLPLAPTSPSATPIDIKYVRQEDLGVTHGEEVHERGQRLRIQ